MRQCYISKNWSQEKLIEIVRINNIISEYEADGYVLTVRQVYYQLVARGYIENTLQSYKRTASLINDAKLSGHIDWDMIEDRTRSFINRNHWENPSQIVRACANQYFQDMWFNQECRVFVIIEKEALVGVLTGLCRELDMPILAARGYPSGSVLRSFAQDVLIPHGSDHGQHLHILHLGDHDPSGIDMTRDLTERLNLFCDGHTTIDLKRIALNMDQIEDQQPPENPAKSTDSRYTQYRQQFGTSSWELDALSPQFLNDLVRSEAESLIDWDLWSQTQDDIQSGRDTLAEAAQRLEDEE